MSVIQIVDEALNLNGTLMSTKTTDLAVSAMDRLTIDAVLASGTWGTAELKLYASADTDGDNWTLVSPAVTIDGASRTFDVDVEDFTWVRLQLGTAEGGVGTADITMTAGAFNDGAWGESIDLNDDELVGDVMDVSTFSSWTGILYAPTMATAALHIEHSVDGVEWDALASAVIFTLDEQTIQADVRGIRLLRARVETAEGGALTGQLNSYADSTVPASSTTDVDWFAATIPAPWAIISGYDGFSHRLRGTTVELRGAMDHGTSWSLPETLFTLPVGQRPLSTKRLQGMIEASGARACTGTIEITTAGAVSFSVAGSTNNGSGWVSLDGLQFSVT